jgi:WD40 repeat protein
LLAYGTGEIVLPWGDSGSAGGTARVIERNGTIVFTGNFRLPIRYVGVSPSGALVFVDPDVDVFELATQQLIFKGAGGGIGFIDGVWHPTLDLLLLTEVLGARIFDPVTHASTSILGRQELPIIDDLRTADVLRTVTSVWSPDGLWAATSTTLGDIYIWDTTRQTNPVQTTFSGHTHSVQNLVWNAATNLIASGDYSGRILVWNPATGEVIRELTGHTAAILDLDWRADGTQLVSTSLDHTLRVWNWPSGEGQVVRNGDLVSAVAYSPDGSELAYGGEFADPDDVRIEIVPVQSLLPPTSTPAPEPTATPITTPTTG